MGTTIAISIAVVIVIIVLIILLILIMYDVSRVYSLRFRTIPSIAENYSRKKVPKIPTYISLTTIPDRIESIEITLKSLLDQTMKVDMEAVASEAP